MTQDSRSRNTILRMKNVVAQTKVPPSTIYYWIALGKFPPPIKLVDGGRAAGWLQVNIDDWIQSRMNKTQGGEK